MYTLKYTWCIQGNKAKKKRNSKKIIPLLTTQPINEIENEPWYTIYMHPNPIWKHVQKKL